MDLKLCMYTHINTLNQNAYICGEKDLVEFNRKINASVICLHCKLDHDSDTKYFNKSVTGFIEMIVL